MTEKPEKFADDVVEVINAANALACPNPTRDKFERLRDALSGLLGEQGLAPEGVEFDMNVFLTSDKMSANTCLHFPGNRLMPPQETGEINVPELLASLDKKYTATIQAIASDWRVMTRAEISAYKLRRIEG